MSDEGPIRTARLLLRPFRAEDAPALVRLLDERDIAKTTGNIPHPYTMADAERFLEARRDPSRTGDTFAITLADSGELVGGIGIAVTREHRRAELGYWISIPCWGRGYATEASRAVVDYAFATFDINRIHACVFGNNPASARVLVKVGMTDEGCSREHWSKWGELLDMRHFAILRRDHEAARTMDDTT